MAYWADEIGYEEKTTFWSDFSIADAFGADAIQDTFNRAFKEWKNNYVYLTELVMVLNHKCWQWYGKGNVVYSSLYEKLYYNTDEYAMEHLTGDEMQYYLSTTD